MTAAAIIELIVIIAQSVQQLLDGPLGKLIGDLFRKK